MRSRRIGAVFTALTFTALAVTSACVPATTQQHAAYTVAVEHQLNPTHSLKGIPRIHETPVRVEKFPPIKQLAVKKKATERDVVPNKEKSKKKKSKTLYLTFDDGPDDRATPEILSILKQYDARATFFVIGGAAQRSPHLIDDIKDAGHAVGNHTWAHHDLTASTVKQRETAIRKTDKAVGGTTCLRPPYGATNEKVANQAQDLGKTIEMWDVDTLDWTLPGKASIKASIINGAHDGNVILMHDGGGDRAQTVGAVRDAVAKLTQDGWTLEALPNC